MFSRHALWPGAQASQLLPRSLPPVRSKSRRSAIEEERAVAARRDLIS